jgi:hypothetical protein
MILIDLESFECKNTKTYIRLESDINMMKQLKDDITQIFKPRQFRGEDKSNRLRNIQKEKFKLKDYAFVSCRLGPGSVPAAPQHPLRRPREI